MDTILLKAGIDLSFTKMDAFQPAELRLKNKFQVDLTLIAIYIRHSLQKLIYLALIYSRDAKMSFHLYLG